MSRARWPTSARFTLHHNFLHLNLNNKHGARCGVGLRPRIKPLEQREKEKDDEEENRLFVCLKASGRSMISINTTQRIHQEKWGVTWRTYLTAGAAATLVA